MTTRDDILAAALAWLKVASVGPTDTPLTDQQVIFARQRSRPELPYLTIELIVFDIPRGSDDERPGIDGGSGDPTKQIRGERSGTLSVQGFGPVTAGWLESAALRLRHNSIMLQLEAAGITINTLAGSTNIAALVDTAFEDRFVQEFEIVYMVESAPEAQSEATTTTTTVTFEGQTSDLVKTIIEPPP